MPPDHDLVPGEEGTRLSRLLLLCILLVAAAWRWMRCAAGLPYLHFWDEPQTVATALQMMQTGDLNPHFFKYGSLPIYASLVVNILHYFRLAGLPEAAPEALANLADIRTGLDTGWHWTISHPSFYLWNRRFTAILGTLCVLMTFFIGRRLGGWKAGLLAAALLAGLDAHIDLSARVYPDIFAATAVLASLLMSLSWLDRGRLSDLVAATGACGLAAASKYNAVVSLLIPGLAVAARSFRPSGDRFWSWIVLLLVPPLVFLVVMPYALLDLPRFIEDAGYEIHHYKVRGGGGSHVEAGGEHLAEILASIATSLGIAGVILALVGLAAIAGHPRGWLFLVFPVVYPVLMSTTLIFRQRSLLVLYPFVTIAAAAGLAVFWTAVRRITVPATPARRRGIAAALLALVWVLLYQHLPSASASWQEWTRTEARSRGVVEAVERAGERGVAAGRVAVESELRVHPADLARLEKSPRVVPLLDILCDIDSYDVVLAAVHHRAYLKENRPLASLLDALLAANPMPVVKEVEGSLFLYLDRPSRNPGNRLLVTPGRGTSLEMCRVAFEPGQVTPDRPDNEPGVLRPAGGPASTPRVELPVGNYAFAWQAKAMNRSGRSALMKSSVVSDDLGEVLMEEVGSVIDPERLRALTGNPSEEGQEATPLNLGQGANHTWPETAYFARPFSLDSPASVRLVLEHGSDRSGRPSIRLGRVRLIQVD